MARLIATCHLSQEELAAKLGKSQSAVANKLRLLRLSGECADLLRSYGLTERHARCLLRLSGEEERLRALRQIGERHLNVAQTEQYIEGLLSDIQQKEPARRPTYIVKDVRLFLNSIRHSVDVMRRAGVDAAVKREETEEEITLTVRIPKGRRESPSPLTNPGKDDTVPTIQAVKGNSTPSGRHKRGDGRCESLPAPGGRRPGAAEGKSSAVSSALWDGECAPGFRDKFRWNRGRFCSP